MKGTIEVNCKDETGTKRLFRPNKFSAGLTKTIYRSNHLRRYSSALILSEDRKRHYTDVISLSICGTLDNLSNTLKLWRESHTVKCECSKDCKGYYESYRLTGTGKRKLKKARERAEARKMLTLWKEIINSPRDF